jgi:hypothetical protein
MRIPSAGALVAGTVLLVVGVVLLLGNAGLIDLDPGVVWAVLLIAMGVAVMAWALVGRRRPAGTGERSVTIPLDGAARMDLSMRIGAGRYLVRGGSAALVEVAADDETVGATVDRSGDTARVRLVTAVDSWSVGRFTGTEWRVQLASGVPCAIDVRAGAGDVDLDLSTVPATSVSCSAGAATLRVVLPRPRGEVPVRIEGGAAQITIEIPAGVEARVASTGFLVASGPRETAGYASARERVTVTVTGGVAQLSVVQGR